MIRVLCVAYLLVIFLVNTVESFVVTRKTFRNSITTTLRAKITPNDGQRMEDYRRAIVQTLKDQQIDESKLGGRELLNLIIKKWGVAYDLQLRKNKPFGEGSENIYVNVMWRYFGQQSFPMNEREYLEHLEAISRYITSLNKVEEFKEKV